MKKSIFTLCACALLSHSLFAQITLTPTNLDLQNVRSTSHMAHIDLSASTVNASNFAPGTNKTWDFSGLAYGAVFTTTRNSAVSPYTYAEDKSYQYGLLTFNSSTENFASVNGIYGYQELINFTYDTLMTPHGIVMYDFTYQANFFSSPYTILPLPVTYNDSWQSDYTYNTQFNFSDTTLLVYNEPTTIHTAFNEQNTVPGWGMLRLRLPDNSNNTSYMQVLQVKKVNNRIDSFSTVDNGQQYVAAFDSLGFSNNYVSDSSISIASIDTMIAIDTMVAMDTVITMDTVVTIDTVVTMDTVVSYDTTFVTNYDTVYHLRPFEESHYQYLFYRRGTITPLMTVNFTDAGFNTIQSIDVNTDNLSPFPESVANTPLADNTNVYPNPVTNRAINIDLSGADGKWSYELYNMAGQVVSNGNLDVSAGKIHAQVSLPASVIPGIYSLQLVNDGEHVINKMMTIAK